LAERLVIGIDDTDAPDTRGTGHVARSAAEGIERAGLGSPRGVTRHQFFVGPGVPMTSRNSAAAIVVEGGATVAELHAFVLGFLLADFVAGSDPGLAVLAGEPGADALSFARRAQRELVTVEEAAAVADEAGVRVDVLGRVGQGRIGALSAAVLRAAGDDGRFIGLPGIRDVPRRLRVAEVLDRVPGVTVVDERDGSSLDPGAILDTGEWLRPRVVGSAPVVVARRRRGRGTWVNADLHLRSKSHEPGKP
jgi:hypothetical protein